MVKKQALRMLLFSRDFRGRIVCISPASWSQSVKRSKRKTKVICTVRFRFANWVLSRKVSLSEIQPEVRRIYRGGKCIGQIGMLNPGSKTISFWCGNAYLWFGLFGPELTSQTTFEEQILQIVEWVSNGNMSNNNHLAFPVAVCFADDYRDLDIEHAHGTRFNAPRAKTIISRRN